MDAVVDVDAIFKLSVYGLFEESLNSIPFQVDKFFTLNSARYVLRDQVSRTVFEKRQRQVSNAIDSSLSLIKEVEPTKKETRFAAELEHIAQKLNVSLDIGESQLCAMVISRKMLCFVTGDKRAIVAAESIYSSELNINNLESKLICLEQIFLWLLDRFDPMEVRSSVCSEKEVDKALSICFSCASHEISPDSWNEGLNSYISELQSQAPTVIFRKSS